MDASNLLAIIAVLLAALVLVVTHFLDHYVFRMRTWEIARYAMGTATIWLGFLVWAIPTGNTPAALVLTAIIVVGGLAIIGLHLLRRALVGEEHRIEVEELRKVVRNGDKQAR